MQANNCDKIIKKHHLLFGKDFIKSILSRILNRMTLSATIKVKQSYAIYIATWLVVMMCFTLFEPAYSQSNSHLLQYEKAKNNLQNGNKNKAIRNLKTICERYPKSTEAPLLLAYIYETDKNFLNAAKFYTLAIRNKPNDALLYFSRGNCYFSLKKYNLAVADYNKTIQYDSLFFGAYNNMALARIFNQGEGQVQIRDADFEMARKNIKKLESMSVINDNKMLTNLGLINLYLFDFNAAMGYFKCVIENDSTNAKAYFFNGLCNYYLRNYTSALRNFNSAKNLGYTDSTQLDELITFTSFLIQHLPLNKNE